MRNKHCQLTEKISNSIVVTTSRNRWKLSVACLYSVFLKSSSLTYDSFCYNTSHMKLIEIATSLEHTQIFLDHMEKAMLS